jgi:hypothetical protein
MALVLKPTYQQRDDGRHARAVAPAANDLDEAALAAFGCDVSFVSDDSTPPEDLVSRAVEQASSHELKHLLWETFDRLRADYRADGAVLHPAGVATKIRRACSALGFDVAAEQRSALLRFFSDVNQVLFQHQTLAWLADDDANLKVQLYGRGWEQHRRFARYARGVICDERMRRAVARASKINLAAGAYGAVTPRLFEGVGDGAFFLMRFCAADVIECFYPPLVEFCARERIETNAALDAQATPGIRAILAFASRTLGVDVLLEWPDFVAHLLSTRGQPHSRSAAVLWPDHYESVCFSSRDELLNLAGKFLYDQPQRRRLADAMRHQLAHPAPPRVSVRVSRSLAPRRARDDVAA